MRTKGGRLLKGKKTPDKRNNGIIRKFIITEKPCMSSSIAPKISPRHVKPNATKNMKKIPKRRPEMLEKWKPKRNEASKKITACITEIVIPETTFPRTREFLEIGATSISFMKPNCLSVNTVMPKKTDWKSRTIPT